MIQNNIKQLSLYGFVAINTGFLLSIIVLIALLLNYEETRQHTAEMTGTYNALLKLKESSESLLTTPDLQQHKNAWTASVEVFEYKLNLLLAIKKLEIAPDHLMEIRNLWQAARSEAYSIREQLENPLLQSRFTIDKPILRRLGESFQKNETSDYFVALSTLINSTVLLTQYENFLIDEFNLLIDQLSAIEHNNLGNIKFLIVIFPPFVFVLAILFSIFLSRRIGRVETQLITTQNDLQDSLNEFEHLFNTTMECILLFSDRKCIDTNQKCLETFGYESQSEMIGISVYDFIAPESKALIRHKIEQDDDCPYEVMALKKDGTVFPALLKCHNFTSTNKRLRIGTLIDLSELKEKDKQLHSTIQELHQKQNILEQQKSALNYQAHYDALTQLPNRVLFFDRLQQALKKAKRHHHKVAIFFVDLDHFKEINDSLGHAAGDRVLQEVAQRLIEHLREVDSIARLGGDEFTVLIDEVKSNKKITDIAQKLLTSFQDPIHMDGHELAATISIGVSIYPDDGQDEGTLLRNADTAMYRAKDEGRNTYQFYTADMTELAFERIAMTSNIRRALEREEFVLHYQPQYNTRTDRLIGMEALVRWQHPDLGMVSPAKFIPLAEESGLIIPLGEWVMRTAFAQISRWRRQGFDCGRMAINLAGKQLQQKELYDIVSRLQESTRCKAEWVELEVTESFIMKDPEHSSALLQLFFDKGYGIAIDDFGTGYSSLAYLKHLPISKLKIDQSFVRDIPADMDDIAISRTVISLAKGLNLDVIAEGVEHQAQKEFLLQEGCENIQGYLYGRPLPAREFEQLLISTCSKRSAQ